MMRHRLCLMPWAPVVLVAALMLGGASVAQGQDAGVDASVSTVASSSRRDVTSDARQRADSDGGVASLPAAVASPAASTTSSATPVLPNPTADGQKLREISATEWDRNDPWPAVVASVSYLLVVMLGFVRFIWTPARLSLQGSIDGLEAELADSAHATQETDVARNLLNKARSQLGTGLLWVWAWSADSGMAAWALYRLAERTSTRRWAIDRVRANLASAADKILACEPSGHVQLLSMVKKALESDPDKSRDHALLESALEVLDTQESAADAAEVTQYYKTVWLAIAAVVILVLAATALGRWRFMFAGAVGGFVSRLSRSARTVSKLPTDEFRWTTHFLSPLSGALTGWAGILLIDLLKQFRVLGEAIPSNIWDQRLEVGVPLSIAFVFGFSERFFDNAIQKFEVTGGSTTTSPGAPSPQDLAGATAGGTGAKPSNATKESVR